MALSYVYYGLGSAVCFAAMMLVYKKLLFKSSLTLPKLGGIILVLLGIAIISFF